MGSNRALAQIRATHCLQLTIVPLIALAALPLARSLNCTGAGSAQEPPSTEAPRVHNTGTSDGTCKKGETYDTDIHECKASEGSGGSNVNLLLTGYNLPNREGSLQRHCADSSYVFVKVCSVPWALRAGFYNVTNSTHLVAAGKNALNRYFRIVCFSAEANKDGGHDPVVCLYKNIRPFHNEAVIFGLEIVCLSLDIVSCGLYLITFILYKGLRNIFGQLVINLIAVIAIGDIFYITSQRLPEENMSTEGFCQFLSILMHYLYLARFAWMTVLSVDIAKTFYLASQLLPKQDRKANRRFLAGSYILAYFSPAIIVLITVIVNYAVGKGAVSYGRTIFGNCWMGSQTAILVSFVLPVALTLMLNVCLALYSIVTLCRVRSVGMQKASRELQRLLTDCRVVFGICSLLGVTWIFGFLALIPIENNSNYDLNFSPMSWAYYPFVILSTTQATVVCITFLLKKEIFDFYSELLSHKSEAFYNACCRCLRRETEESNSTVPLGKQQIFSGKDMQLVLSTPPQSPMESPL